MSGKKNKRLLGSYFYFPVGCYSNDCITLVFGENRIYPACFLDCHSGLCRRLPRLVGLYECADQPSHKET